MYLRERAKKRAKLQQNLHIHKYFEKKNYFLAKKTHNLAFEEQNKGLSMVKFWYYHFFFVPLRPCFDYC